MKTTTKVPAMVTNSRKVTIEWGDCDPAGIVFYPRYFAFFDASTWALFTYALGMRKSALIEQHGIVGCPMVDLRSRFLIPSAYGDEVTIESQVQAFRRSSFDVQHRLLRSGQLAVECVETRVWAGIDPEKPGRLRSRAIPDAVRSALSHEDFRGPS
jgi:4-hydroxybenzoyl-CoA thioesterase